MAATHIYIYIYIYIADAVQCYGTYRDFYVKAMRRQKRKPDTVRLNYVESHPRKRRSVRLRTETYSLASIPPGPSQQNTCTSSSSSFPPDDSSCAVIDYQCSSDSLPDTSHCYTDRNFEAHTTRRERAAKAWSEVRGLITPTIVSTMGFPKQATCVFCKKSEAYVWCKECGSCAYFCEECAMKLHTNINIFHSPLLWKVLYVFL